MSGHTPGPWRYKRTHQLSADTWYVIADANGRGPIVDVGGSDETGQIAEAKRLVTDPKTIAANARLIAAAPELLEVAKEVQKWLEYHADATPESRGAWSLWERVKDAASKAEVRL